MDWSDFFKLCVQVIIGAFVLFTVVVIGSSAMASLKKRGQ